MSSVHSHQSQANLLLNLIAGSGLPAAASRMPVAISEATHFLPPNQSLAHQMENHFHPLPAAHYVVEEPAMDPIVPAPVTTNQDAPILIPKDNSINDDQLAALVSSREREVTDLQSTLSQPLATFNAKFIWHCIMNIEPDCETAFLEKIKAIHKTFYLPPAVAFYALWLHFRFWDRMPKIYYAIDALLPQTSSSGLSKPARVSIIMYMLSASFANKHLDDFSYRNSSWYEAARLPAKDFLEVELLALKELSWSLEISTKEWNNWLQHLRTANISLERTRPTTETYHFVLARLLQDAIVATGDKDEFAIWRRGRQRNRLTAVGAGLWDNYSPTLLSSEGQNTSTARANDNIANGPYGLYALQQKLDRMHQPFHEALYVESVTPKFIPWDTTLDPVVHVRPRARSGSGSGAVRTRSISESGAGVVPGEMPRERRSDGGTVGGDRQSLIRDYNMSGVGYPVTTGGAGVDVLAGRRSSQFFGHPKNATGHAQTGYGYSNYTHFGALKTCNGPIGSGRGVGVVGDGWHASL